MSRSNVVAVQVEFGDCGPSRIVFFPNFLRWADAAGHAFFLAAGVPPWHELESKSGIIGTPLVDLQVKFIAAARWGDRLAIRTSIAEWRRTSFVMHHEIFRGDELLVASDEVRVFVRRVGTGPTDIEAMAVPQDIKSLCDGTADSPQRG